MRTTQVSARASVERTLPTAAARDLIARTRELVGNELRPRVTADESRGRFPREVFTSLGRSGLLGLPYPAKYGGGEQPYVVYLQVLEELAAGWLAIGLGVSVHTLACHAPATFGSEEQKHRWLPDMLGGSLLGAYCLSEPESGSDAASLRTRAVQEGTHYVVDGTKAWTTHGGVADFYTVMVRTGAEGPGGVTVLLVPGDASGLSSAPREHKMGLSASPTAQMRFEGVRVPAGHRIGAEGQGFTIALSALDCGRLGIAACAVGVAQAAMDATLNQMRASAQPGQTVADGEGVSFMLADMATQIAAARALYLAVAARRDAGAPSTEEAAIAKLFCTDAAMRVTLDAVQVLGARGGTQEHPVERYMREAKALQIVEGPNQIQRLIIARGRGR